MIIIKSIDSLAKARKFLSFLANPHTMACCTFEIKNQWAGTGKVTNTKNQKNKLFSVSKEKQTNFFSRNKTYYHIY